MGRSSADLGFAAFSLPPSPRRFFFDGEVIVGGNIERCFKSKFDDDVFDCSFIIALTFSAPSTAISTGVFPGVGGKTFLLMAFALAGFVKSSSPRATTFVSAICKFRGCINSAFRAEVVASRCSFCCCCCSCSLASFASSFTFSSFSSSLLTSSSSSSSECSSTSSSPEPITSSSSSLSSLNSSSKSSSKSSSSSIILSFVAQRRFRDTKTKENARSKKKVFVFFRPLYSHA